MKRRLFYAVFSLLLLALPLTVWAQTRSASNAEREVVLRELENRLRRERGADVEVRIELAEAYSSSFNETSVRGRAQARSRNQNWEPLWFDSVFERRGGRVTRLDWGYGNQRGESRPDNRYPTGGGVLRNGRYEIQLVATNRLLDIGNGGQVVQRDANRTRSQQWDIESVSGNYYLIRSAETGEVMTVEGRGDSGSNILLARERRNDDAQWWEVRSGPDNGYYFIARNGKSLDSPSSARHDGGRLQLYNRNGEANQRFLLRLLDDRARYDNRDRNRDRYDDRNRDRERDNYGSGRLSWRGRVDGEVEIEVRGTTVRERNLSGQPPFDVRVNSGWSLPRREVTVRVNRLRGRGRVEVVEQPSSRNGYVAVIRISDPDRGADDYELEISWN